MTIHYLIAEAEDQLSWGTDLEQVQAVASDLRQADPNHALVRRLEAKIARMRSVEEMMVPASRLPN